MRSAITRFTFLTVAATALVFAQNPGRGGQQRPQVDRSAMLERRVERLALLLNLTEAQKAQAKAIFEKEQTDVQALRDQVRTANEALRGAVRSTATDTEIDTLAATVGTLHGRTLAIHTKAAAAFYRLLTAEQRDKYDKLRPMGMGGMGPMGGPGMGPMRMGRGRQ